MLRAAPSVGRCGDEPTSDRPPVQRLRRRHPAVAGALPHLRRVGHPRRGATAGGGRRSLRSGGPPLGGRPPRGGGGPARGGAPPPARAVPLGEVDLAAEPTRPTGIGELDRVLGGGLVPGSVTLLGGEPGIGKSSLLLQAVAALAGAGSRCLLVTAEESAAQVRIRAERLRALAPRVPPPAGARP